MTDPTALIERARTYAKARDTVAFELINSLATALTAEIAARKAAEKDAERYEFIRGYCYVVSVMTGEEVESDDHLDQLRADLDQQRAALRDSAEGRKG